MMASISAHCHHFSFTLLSFLKAVLSACKLNVISLLAVNGKLSICTVVFLDTELKAFILGSGMDHSPLYSLVTNQEQQFTFLYRESDLCESAEYL